jgi:hemerythrin superfamily protein
MDAIEQLVRDHETIEAIFTDYGIAASPPEKREAVEKFTRELSMHAALEEQLVYPILRFRVQRGRADADESVNEHQRVKRLLADLEKLDTGETDYYTKSDGVITEVRKHVTHEETVVLPKIREALSERQLTRLGELLGRAKGLMPTHPHPLVPGTATAQLLAGPWASIADHLRDFVESVRRRD